MGERTKQILIAAVGVVVLGVGYLIYLIEKPSPAFHEIRCPNGTPAYMVNPESYLLKYSGKSVMASAQWKEAILKLGVEDKAIEKATEAVALLDQRLRPSVLMQAATACDPAGRDLWVRMESYRSGEAERLVQLAAELKKIGQAGDAAQSPRAAAIVTQDIPGTVQSANEKLSPPPKP
jgi:hypothetical protein